MKLLLFCSLSAAVASVVTGMVLRKHVVTQSHAMQEQAYNEALQKSFTFSNGFTFQLEDILIQTYPQGAGWTRIIGQVSRQDVPMSIDLVDETGASIFSQGEVMRRAPWGEGKFIHEAFISIWTNSPGLKLVATIFPNDKSLKQTLSESIPNPIHFHRLFDLDGKDSSVKSIGPVETDF